MLGTPGRGAAIGRNTPSVHEAPDVRGCRVHGARLHNWRETTETRGREDETKSKTDSRAAIDSLCLFPDCCISDVYLKFWPPRVLLPTCETRAYRECL